MGTKYNPGTRDWVTRIVRERLGPGQQIGFSLRLIAEAFPGDAAQQGLSEFGQDIMIFAFAAARKTPPTYRTGQQQIDDFCKDEGVQSFWSIDRQELYVRRPPREEKP